MDPDGLLYLFCASFTLSLADFRGVVGFTALLEGLVVVEGLAELEGLVVLEGLAAVVLSPLLLL